MVVKPLQPIKLDNLGTAGLNTQGSGSTLEPAWLTEASNIVFDFQGRIGPRKGIKQTSVPVSNPVKSLGEFVKSDRTTEYYCAAGASVYKIDTSVVPNTMTTQSFSGTPQTITDSNWQWINFNDEFWAVQRGHMPINYDGTNWYDIDDLGTYAAPSGVTTFDPNCALGDFGRVWYGGVTEDPGVVYYSDNLIGEALTGGASGVLDLKTVWGNDEIVGLASLMDKLIIFGKNNIAIYGGAADPNTMALDELIKGIGLAGRDNTVYVSSELLFMSYEGLQSLSRITETDGKSPLTDLSIAVRNTLAYYLSSANLDTVKSVYYQEEGLVVTFVPDKHLAYVFDFSTSTQSKIPRVTTWNFSNPPLCGLGSIDGDFHLGLSNNSTGFYTGYYDVVISDSTVTNPDQPTCEVSGGVWDGSKCWTTTNKLYNYTWSSSWMDLGSPAISKMLKTGIFTYSGGRNAHTALQVFTDYSASKSFTKNFALTLDDDSALYGEEDALYAESLYTAKVGPVDYKIPLAREGKVIKLKMVTEVVGDYSSLEAITLLTKQGKIR